MKILYATLMLTYTLIAFANGCDEEFVETGTNANGNNTTDWLTVSTDFGLLCDIDMLVTTNAQQGDYAYTVNYFDDIVGNTIYFTFGLDMKKMLQSFNKGDRITFFQVRTDNPDMARMLALKVKKHIGGNNALEPEWKLEVVWFEPGNASVNRSKTVHSLYPDERGEVHFIYEFSEDGTSIQVDGSGTITSRNPFGVSKDSIPEHNRLGLIGSNPYLKQYDNMRFFGAY